MEGLDLNTDSTSFPYMGSYQGLLQGDSIPDGRGLPPIRIDAKSSGVLFVPPRPTIGASGSRKCPASRGVVRRTRVGTGGARAGSTVNRAPTARMRGSVASGSSYPPTEGMELEDDDDVPPEVRFSMFNLFSK